MKKYYFNDGTSQQGPFTIEELQAKNITAETPVWYDGLPDWTTAGQVEELKNTFIHTPPPFHAASASPVAEVKPVVTATPAKPAKNSTAWLSYVLALLVLGGVGYLVYQDMEKNKGNTGNTTTMTSAIDSTANTESHQIVVEPTNETTQPEAAKEEAVTAAPVTTTTAVTTENQPPVATTAKTQKATLTTPTAKPGTGTTTKAQQAEAQKLAQKKAEEENKKLQAALASAALKEKEYRNNWPKYITFGKLDYTTKDDGVEAFNVPVYNGTNAMLDKVTVRVDYMRKEKKVLKSETIFIYNIPPGAGLNGKAPASKKGNNVKVFITGVTSRKLHFCYPANIGNSADPYFCN